MIETSTLSLLIYLAGIIGTGLYLLHATKKPRKR
ncbi:hypothetical protein GeomeDRAFT_3333 [Geobacter metallireducens RCH3]|nr:hypothetical protein GeomeDRAFT_3333 [Geobacter metallireducens RCH3]